MIFLHSRTTSCPHRVSATSSNNSGCSRKRTAIARLGADGSGIHKEISRIPDSVLNELVAYDWPGNVRELEHVLERSIITSPGRHLQLAERLCSVVDEAHRDVLQSHSDMEREHILRVLEQTGWVIEGPGGAARILDIHPNTLRYRMKKLAINRPGK